MLLSLRLVAVLTLALQSWMTALTMAPLTAALPSWLMAWTTASLRTALALQKLMTMLIMALQNWDERWESRAVDEGCREHPQAKQARSAPGSHVGPLPKFGCGSWARETPPF